MAGHPWEINAMLCALKAAGFCTDFSK